VIRDKLQGRLLSLAAAFLTFYALALTLSPAVRARSWQVDYRWDHWVGLVIWLLIFSLAHSQALRHLPERDPFILPIVGLLSGWGMLTIWRLLPMFGLRQSLWILVAGGVLIAGLRLPTDLSFLRRYKYLWLTGSLLLTALTLFFGVNPMGYGPRMWLGCCGVYLQPSEPLKLLLIAYLAAYLADHYPFLLLESPAPTAPGAPEVRSPGARLRLLPLLAPTLLMTGLALVLLGVQRDLGTAVVFLVLYSVILYAASGHKSVWIIAALGIVLAGIAGYWLFDIVRLRVDAWLNPWLDPSGGAFQIVQSLLAIANGGMFGRGPGVGNPGLVPLVHSDLVFAAISEEFGLFGAVGLLLVIALFASRTLRVSLNAADPYSRYLAMGLTAYLVGQSFLIIAGGIRLLPLTGITLPFVSYGGSSLLVSFISGLLLLLISSRTRDMPVRLPLANLYPKLGGVLFAALAVAALACGWWAVVRGEDLLSRTDNPRLAIADRWVHRGTILDRHNYAINASVGNPGELERRNYYPDLSNVVGYTNPVYGQSGLEASLDDALRGIKYNPGLMVWWNRLLYGQPPPGLDVRLSLDLDIQSLADRLLGGSKGALVLLNATSGEILSMASHPTFDANKLVEQWGMLVDDPDSPLLNRATQGLYPVGALDKSLLGQSLSELGFNSIPRVGLPGEDLVIGLNQGFSPIQIALASAALTANGVAPAPLLVAAINTSQSGWVVPPSLAEPRQVLSAEDARSIALSRAVSSLDIWESKLEVRDNPGRVIAWYVGGSLPDWLGAPLSVVVVLEDANQELAQVIGRAMLGAGMGR
jgi:cell division protein FtsW (lipid II flippase)